MASHGYSQLDINQQREKLRKLEREIQNELAELNRSSHIINKRQKSPRLHTPNKLPGPNKRSQTPQPYGGYVRTQTEKRQIQHHGNRPVNEMDQDYGNIATSEKVSLNISKEHLNQAMQQLEEFENLYDENLESTNYDQSMQRTPLRTPANQRDPHYRDYREERSESPPKSSERSRTPQNLKKGQKNFKVPVFDEEDHQFLRQYGKRVSYNVPPEQQRTYQENRSPVKQNSKSPNRTAKSRMRTEEISVYGKNGKKPEVSNDHRADTTNYFKPKISEKSREIAARMGNPLERLVSGHLPSKYKNKEAEQYPFRPQINRISEALDEHFRKVIFNGDELYRWDQLYLMRDKYKIERELKRIEYEKEQLANSECTFAPNILSPLPGYDNQRAKKTDVIQRSYQWAKQREQRLQKDREEREQRDLDECTFQPDLEKERAKLGLSFSKSNANIHERPFLVQGLEQYFERVDQAKRIQQEKQVAQSKFSGQGWANIKTKPQAPQLGRKSELKRQASISPVKKLTGYKYSRSPNKLNTSVNKENMGSIFLDMNRSAFIDDVEDEEKFTDAIAELHEELHRIEINQF